jgi:AraC family transcriptional regulator of adaptative response/methylated-DNA-[protein]-cysteine methyltransferase
VAILLGDDTKALTADLRYRFPKSELIVGDVGFEKSEAKVVCAVEAPDSKLDLSPDLRGTEFQQRVWQALREIPTGPTARYKEIARKVGMSKTAQDVAGACGANVLAVVVPCHRVIRSDGSLGGYRWGIKRKRALLEKEQEAAP